MKVAAPPRKRAPVADRKAREALRKADPVLGRIIDENPRSFVSKWTAHVGVLRSYPWLLRWLFSVPKKMTTIAMLEWLERRYAGSIVIDFASLNRRGRALARAITAYTNPATIRRA